MSLLISWAVLTFSMFAATRLLDGIKIKGGVVDHLVVAAIFGTLMFFLGQLVYFVLGVLSLGFGFLFAFVTRLITAALLLKLTDRLSKRLSVKGFGTAIAAALVMAVVGTGTDWVLSVVLR